MQGYVADVTVHEQRQALLAQVNADSGPLMLSLHCLIHLSEVGLFAGRLQRHAMVSCMCWVRNTCRHVPEASNCLNLKNNT
jgi:hypothetical protein